LKRPRRDILILLVVAAFVVLVDQYTKSLVAARLGVGDSWDVVPWLVPVFRITHVTNTGVAFGLFPGGGDFFTVVSAVVTVIILVYCWQLPPELWLMRVVLALPLGGATGNLVDRLRQGFVVDFIDLNFWPLHEWPIFNLADSSIVAGVTLLTLLMLWEERRERSERGEQQMVEGS
jgi:signal peptidase II